MNKYTVYILFFACFIFVLISACKRQQQVTINPENTFSVKGSVREMDLYPDPPPAFPDHEGKSQFIAYCAICHSLKYISTQPNFPAKTWEAEVNKMIIKYHAPIDSATAKVITAYLVAVKSKH